MTGSEVFSQPGLFGRRAQAQRHRVLEVRPTALGPTDQHGRCGLAGRDRRRRTMGGGPVTPRTVPPLDPYLCSCSCPATRPERGRDSHAKSRIEGAEADLWGCSGPRRGCRFDRLWLFIDEEQPGGRSQPGPGPYDTDHPAAQRRRGLLLSGPHEPPAGAYVNRGRRHHTYC